MKMRGWLLSVGSIFLTSLVIGNAYYQKQQFYPSVVYITKSNPSLAVLYLQAFVFVLLLGQLSRKVFFGQLRPAETEHLIERSWYAVTETCLAFTVFRDNFSPLFVAQFTMLLFLKCFHWLSEDRVEYMERSPMISFLFHIRVISLLTLLGTLDSLLIHKAYHSVLSSGASTQLVFGFEYAILLTIIVAVFMKYVLHTIDLQSVNPWENKAVYILYSELVMGFIKSVLYITFMVIMIRVHTFPLFAIRPMYLTLRSFKKAVSDVIMSRRAILNMNTLYPDATPEELASGDNVCIICREEMTTNAKKLPCNHIFHISCLRSWFQRQQTCPTCRMDVLQPQQTRPAHAVPAPPQPGVPHHGHHMPPPFPMFPMAFRPPPPPGPPSGQGPTPAQTPPTTQGAPSTTTSQPPSMSNPMPLPGPLPPFIPPFPMVPPPMFGFPFPPAPSTSSVGNLSSLTLEELRAMEGEERQNVEARIAVLRNVHSLLDTAIMQLNQYSQAVAATQTPTFGPGIVHPPTANQNPSSNPVANITEDVNPSADVPGPSWEGVDDDVVTNNEELRTTTEPNTAEDLENAGSRNDLRQRRIERFSSQPNNDIGDE